jgi:hypothetical protein
MASFTVSVSCSSDLYPNNFCLIYGSSDCAELCNNWVAECTTTTTTTNCTTRPGGLTEYSFSEESILYSNGETNFIGHTASFTQACNRWTAYYPVLAKTSRGYIGKVVSLAVGQRIYYPIGEDCEGWPKGGWVWVMDTQDGPTITIVEIKLEFINGIYVQTILSLQDCTA